MKISKEIKVALFTIVSLVLLYFGFQFLKGADFLTRTNRFYADYDNVEGLTISNPVILNGLSVGRVSAIKLQTDSSGRYVMRVEMEIDKKITLGDSSVATLGDNGLLGGKAILLTLGRTNPEKPLASGSNLRTAKAGGLMSKAEPLANKVDSIALKFNKLLDELQGAGTKINDMLGSLAGLAENTNGMIGENRVALKTTLANFQELSRSFVDTEKQLKALMVKSNNFADKLNAMELQESVANANKALASLNETLQKANNPDGTMGALMQDRALYDNLKNLSESLDKLAEDLRENPRRYINVSVFGRKDKSEKDKK
jgi:phospholipid/cholesterol/gamma-HCH transport system substrate-binding protein